MRVESIALLALILAMFASAAALPFMSAYESEAFTYRMFQNGDYAAVRNVVSSKELLVAGEECKNVFDECLATQEKEAPDKKEYIKLRCVDEAFFCSQKQVSAVLDCFRGVENACKNVDAKNGFSNPLPSCFELKVTPPSGQAGRPQELLDAAGQKSVLAGIRKVVSSQNVPVTQVRDYAKYVKEAGEVVGQVKKCVSDWCSKAESLANACKRGSEAEKKACVDKIQANCKNIQGIGFPEPKKISFSKNKPAEQEKPEEDSTCQTDDAKLDQQYFRDLGLGTKDVKQSIKNLLEEIRQNVRESSTGLIEGTLPDTRQTARDVLDGARQAIKEPKLDLALKGLATEPAKPKAKPAETSLDTETLARVKSEVSSLKEKEAPEWLKGVNIKSRGFFKNLGAALMAHAPDAVKNGNDCTKAMYVYGLGLPVMDKAYGFRQLDGTSIPGACRALASQRGFMRIADSTIGAGFNWLGKKISDARGKKFSETRFSPEDVLLQSRQGTCGEWGYGLREVMEGAGLKSSVIVAVNPRAPSLNNHAATVVECKAGDKVEKRVCDAWYLGHENQRRDKTFYVKSVFQYGHFDNAVDSVYNCMPLQDWLERQKEDSKTVAANPDLNPDYDPSTGFQTERDQAITQLKQTLDTSLPLALKNNWDSAKLKQVLEKNFAGLYKGEESAVISKLIKEYSNAARSDEEKEKLSKLADGFKS